MKRILSTALILLAVFGVLWYSLPSLAYSTDVVSNPSQVNNITASFSETDYSNVIAFDESNEDFEVLAITSKSIAETSEEISYSGDFDRIVIQDDPVDLYRLPACNMQLSFSNPTTLPKLRSGFSEQFSRLTQEAAVFNKVMKQALAYKELNAWTRGSYCYIVWRQVSQKLEQVTNAEEFDAIITDLLTAKIQNVQARLNDLQKLKNRQTPDSTKLPETKTQTRTLAISTSRLRDSPGQTMLLILPREKINELQNLPEFQNFLTEAQNFMNAVKEADKFSELHSFTRGNFVKNVWTELSESLASVKTNQEFNNAINSLLRPKTKNLKELTASQKTKIQLTLPQAKTLKPKIIVKTRFDDKDNLVAELTFEPKIGKGVILLGLFDENNDPRVELGPFDISSSAEEALFLLPLKDLSNGEYTLKVIAGSREARKKVKIQGKPAVSSTDTTSTVKSTNGVVLDKTTLDLSASDDKSWITIKLPHPTKLGILVTTQKPLYFEAYDETENRAAAVPLVFRSDQFIWYGSTTTDPTNKVASGKYTLAIVGWNEKGEQVRRYIEDGKGKIVVTVIGSSKPLETPSGVKFADNVKLRGKNDVSFPGDSVQVEFQLVKNADDVTLQVFDSNNKLVGKSGVIGASKGKFVSGTFYVSSWTGLTLDSASLVESGVYSLKLAAVIDGKNVVQDVIGSNGKQFVLHVNEKAKVAPELRGEWLKDVKIEKTSVDTLKKETFKMSFKPLKELEKVQFVFVSVSGTEHALSFPGKILVQDNFAWEWDGVLSTKKDIPSEEYTLKVLAEINSKPVEYTHDEKVEFFTNTPPGRSAAGGECPKPADEDHVEGIPDRFDLFISPSFTGELRYLPEAGKSIEVKDELIDKDKYDVNYVLEPYLHLNRKGFKIIIDYIDEVKEKDLCEIPLTVALVSDAGKTFKRKVYIHRTREEYPIISHVQLINGKTGKVDIFRTKTDATPENKKRFEPFEFQPIPTKTQEVFDKKTFNVFTIKTTNVKLPPKISMTLDAETLYGEKSISELEGIKGIAQSLRPTPDDGTAYFRYFKSIFAANLREKPELRGKTIAYQFNYPESNLIKTLAPVSFKVEVIVPKAPETNGADWVKDVRLQDGAQTTVDISKELLFKYKLTLLKDLDSYGDFIVAFYSTDGKVQTSFPVGSVELSKVIRSEWYLLPSFFKVGSFNPVLEAKIGGKTVKTPILSAKGTEPAVITFTDKTAKISPSVSPSVKPSPSPTPSTSPKPTPEETTSGVLPEQLEPYNIWDGCPGMEGENARLYSLQPGYLSSKSHRITFKTTGTATSEVRCRSANYFCVNGFKLSVGLNFYPASPEDVFEIFDKTGKRLFTFGGAVVKDGFSGFSNDYNIDTVYFTYSGAAKSKLDVTTIKCYTS